jgi:hypothetical protein
MGAKATGFFKTIIMRNYFLNGIFNFQSVLAVAVMMFVAMSCSSPGGSSSFAMEVEQTDTLIAPGNLLTIQDAERILGEPAYVVDSSAGGDSNLRTWHLAYKAKAVDPRTKRNGAVYYLLEQYQDAPAAHSKYQSIKKANEAHGIIIRHDLGDEAYFHTDNSNFYFIMLLRSQTHCKISFSF